MPNKEIPPFVIYFSPCHAGPIIKSGQVEFTIKHWEQMTNKKLKAEVVDYGLFIKEDIDAK